MVMSFFRRSDGSARYSAGSTSPGQKFDIPPATTASDPLEYQAVGLALEENKQSSEELIETLSFLQDRVSTLLDSHGRSLNETTTLRAECARIGSLLDYEGNTRRKYEQENGRLISENKDVRADNVQLRVETESVREEFIKLQALHGVTSEELSIISGRLSDAERELVDRSGQFDEATALVRRAQAELEARGREISQLRERLDTEVTAHQLLNETSHREIAGHERELARLNDEKAQLKSALSQSNGHARSLQTAVASLRQEQTALEEKERRLEEELENLQSTSALQIANLTTRQEAMQSKAELVEKLLATANGRNRMTEEELRAMRGELKRAKADLDTTNNRNQRLTDELERFRSAGSQSEAARRELAAQSSELALKLRELQGTSSQRDRDWQEARRDMEVRGETDRTEIGQLRTELEVARAEIRQLRTERSILAGQLEAARSLRQPEPALDTYRPTAQPLIEISEASLLHRPANSSIVDPIQAVDTERLPPAE
jgi:chromosome segregation ATPase